MNSTVIKVVAGGGKTTESEKILKDNANGLYLSYNKTVVEELNHKGYISKTIDALFMSFIIPKFFSLIPIINCNSKIIIVDSGKLSPRLKGTGNLSIDETGQIYNRNKKTEFSLNIDNKTLHSYKSGKNLSIVKFVFGCEKLRLTHKLRDDLSSYLLKNYPNEIIRIIGSRFAYVIFDESQDLKNHREQLAKLIYQSSIQAYYLGDQNQNINGGGEWFENVSATKQLNCSFRCPENNCKWIRNNLDIVIYGNFDNPDFSFTLINIEDVLMYDNGKRILLYNAASGNQMKNIINQWKGGKYTIKTAKGKTIDKDIVIIGKGLNKKSYYTAITRTTKNVYSTINKIT